ncbi:MAG: hypothetical protein JO036_06160 [Candidatus Eremiobacteraeota bacterium]|nr:hypothetical protein [Candidatus Eremiobacteraeota bacterium]
MIERFNFYDVYGYLIPGLTLVILLWLPVGIITGKLPDDKAASLAVVLVIAYIIGLHLHSMATNAYPSRTMKGSDGNPQYPSVGLLDEKSEIGTDLKRRLQKNVESWFGIDIAAGKDANTLIAQRRQDAYNLCRPIVTAQKSYAEQFQGLYALARGMSVSCALAAPYYLGWAAWVWKRKDLGDAALVIIAAYAAIALCVAVAVALGKGDRLQNDQLGLFVVAILLLGSGYLVGSRFTVSSETSEILIIGAIVLIAVSVRFFALYKYFTVAHARTLWSEFASNSPERPRP